MTDPRASRLIEKRQPHHPRKHPDIVWTAGKLYGYPVQATGPAEDREDTVGQVSDFYFDDQEWLIRYVVVDTGPWLLGRQVLLDASVLGQPFESAQRLTVALTREQIENSPDIDLHRPVSRQQLLDLHGYYGWPLPIYWGDMAIPGWPIIGVYPTPALPEESARKAAAEDVAARGRAKEQRASPHLHSTRKVGKYRIQAIGGPVGHVEDFYINGDRWAIHYLLANTRQWLPGRKVLIAPEWIERLSWTESKVYVRLTREEIKTSPEHDPSLPITHQEEILLYKHYGQLEE